MKQAHLHESPSRLLANTSTRSCLPSSSGLQRRNPGNGVKSTRYTQQQRLLQLQQANRSLKTEVVNQCALEHCIRNRHWCFWSTLSRMVQSVWLTRQEDISRPSRSFAASSTSMKTARTRALMVRLTSSQFVSMWRPSLQKDSNTQQEDQENKTLRESYWNESKPTSGARKRNTTQRDRV